MEYVAFTPWQIEMITTALKHYQKYVTVNENALTNTARKDLEHLIKDVERAEIIIHLTHEQHDAHMNDYMVKWLNDNPIE